MSPKVKNILLSILAVLLLVIFAAAIPSGTLTQEARKRHLDDMQLSDEFIFEDEFVFADDDEMIFVDE